MFNKTIYILRAYLINKQSEKHPYIKLKKGVRGYYSSLRKAEKVIKEIVKEYERNQKFAPYAFHVAEIPWGKTFDELIISERLYGADGVLLDKTARSEGSLDDYKKFPNAISRYPGRTPDQIRFKVGDIVEILFPRECSAKLMIVGRVPFGPERVKELENDPEDPSTDIPDEYACYDPLDGKRFYYYPPTRMMAPTFLLEESVKETYRKYMAEAAEKRIVPRRTW